MKNLIFTTISVLLILKSPAFSQQYTTDEEKELDKKITEQAAKAVKGGEWDQNFDVCMGKLKLVEEELKMLKAQKVSLNGKTFDYCISGCVDLLKSQFSMDWKADRKKYFVRASDNKSMNDEEVFEAGKSSCRIAYNAYLKSELFSEDAEKVIAACPDTARDLSIRKKTQAIEAGQKECKATRQKLLSEYGSNMAQQERIATEKAKKAGKTLNRVSNLNKEKCEVTPAPSIAPVSSDKK